jgi:hypothetical protein
MLQIYEFRDELDHDDDWVMVNRPEQRIAAPLFITSWKKPGRDAPNFEDHFIKIDENI